MKKIILNFLLITLILPAYCMVKQDTLIVKVMDEQAIPIPGVIILQLPESYLLGSTDENGILKIPLYNNLLHKQIKCQHLSYRNYSISWEELEKNPSVILQEKVNELPEAMVKAHPLSSIIPDIHKSLHKKYKAKRTYVRYYAEASYSKAVANKDRTLQLRHEYGLFITSEDNYQKEKWDLSYQHSFIPIYSARSFDLTSDGKDTLKYYYMAGLTDDEKNYNAYEVHITKIIRSIYLYGPLFYNPQTYNFKLIDADSLYYTVEFSTKPQCYPQQTKVFSRGILKIEHQTKRLKCIDFEYLDYYLVYFIRNQSDKAPYVTKAYAEFKYDQEDHAYISYCSAETSWKFAADVHKGIYSVENPSRPFPSRNQLVEKEIFKCENYKPIPQKYRTTATAMQAGWANRSWASYDPEFFKEHPNPLATPKAIEDLNRYMPLEQQYRQNSNKFYGYENDEFEIILEAKRIILNLFPITK